MGDLYLIGKPLLAAYSAFRSGHALNNKLLRALLARPGCLRGRDLRRREAGAGGLRAAGARLVVQRRRSAACGMRAPAAVAAGPPQVGWPAGQPRATAQGRSRCDRGPVLYVPVSSLRTNARRACCDPRRSRRAACACVIAMPSASAASLPGSPGSFSSRFTISCTCALAARPCAGHGLLHLQRRVFGHRQVAGDQRGEAGAARLAQQQRGLRIDVDEHDLDRGRVGLVARARFRRCRRTAP